MTFDARQEAAAIDEKVAEAGPFTFTGMDGIEYELPSVLTLTARQALRFEEGDIEVLNDIAPKAYDALLDLPSGVLEKLQFAWLEHGGRAGKAASPSQRRRAGGTPSSPTSPPQESSQPT